MNKSDTKLGKSVGTVALDAIATTVDAALFGGAPLITSALGLTKALVGNGLALRESKAIEWVKMIQENPEIFVKEVFELEEFQDAFVISLEGYLRERNVKKRSILREIFKDYTKNENPTDYPLERHNEITRQLSIQDAKLFSYLFMLGSEQNRSFQSDDQSPEGLDSLYHLIYLGLLIRDETSPTVWEGKVKMPYINISNLGYHYSHFIQDSGISYDEE